MSSYDALRRREQPKQQEQPTKRKPQVASLVMLKYNCLKMKISRPINNLLNEIVEKIGLVNLVRLIADQVGYQVVVEAVAKAAAIETNQYKQYAKTAKRNNSSQANIANFNNQAVQLQQLADQLNQVNAQPGEKQSCLAV